MRYLIAFAVLASVIGVILFAYEPSTAQDRRRNGSPNKRPWGDVFEEERKEIFEFRPVQPDSLPYDRYIWTPRDVYLVGDKIPLYIEEVSVRKKFGYNVLSVAWQAKYALKIKRGKYLLSDDWGNTECGPFPDGPQPPEKTRSDYIPPIEEIDISRLHGRLVFPVENPGPLSMPDSVECEVGECLVKRLIDLTAGWCTKKAPDGRTLVRFIKWELPTDGHIVLDTVWLDIRGVYQVQWGCSNIIKFEIR